MRLASRCLRPLPGGDHLGDFCSVLDMPVPKPKNPTQTYTPPGLYPCG